MADSLKYGLPSGIFSFGLLYLQLSYFHEMPSIARWLLDGIVVQWIILASIKKSNQAYFPYSIAFFSGFNILFISILTKGFLMLLLRNEVMTKAPDGISTTKWLGFQIFSESLGHFSIAIFSLIVLAWVLKKKKKQYES